MSPLRWLALCAWFCALSTAPGEETRIPACFYAFGYAPGHETVAHPSGNDGFTPIRLSTANIIGPVETIVRDRRIQLFSAAPPAAGGTPARTLLAEAALPPGIRSALVVLLPAPPEEPKPYRALVLEHDPAGFPLGVYRLINLSTHPVRGAVGKEIVQAAPGGIADLQPDGPPGSVQPVRFEYRENERWNLLTETRAAIRKDRRWLMCIHQDPATGRMNIRTIPDRSPITRPPAPSPQSIPTPEIPR